MRWVGQHQPGWRASVLTQPASAAALAIIPTPDLGVGGTAFSPPTLLLECQASAMLDARPWLSPLRRPTCSTFARTVESCGPSRRRNSVHGAITWSIAGVQGVANNATFTLDGSGEMIAVADTGLDQNHPDLTGRVAATNTQFGSTPHRPTPTAGTARIAISVLGNGSETLTHGALHLRRTSSCALEHDPTGTFGRIGSIYDMLDAEQ